MVLAGGTGGAKLAAALQSLILPANLSVVANTADDDEFWGLLVSPDLDAVLYRLAGLFNEEAGYGVKGDSFHVLDALVEAGEASWLGWPSLPEATVVTIPATCAQAMACASASSAQGLS